MYLIRGTNLWKPHGARGVFGGQVIGQTLVAAGKTIKENWHVHSMHGYFLQKGSILFIVVQCILFASYFLFCTFLISLNLQGTSRSQFYIKWTVYETEKALVLGQLRPFKMAS